MSLAEPVASAVFGTEHDREYRLLGSTLSQGYEPGTSHRLGVPARYHIIKKAETTSWIITRRAVGRTVSAMVKHLRDHISAQTRLTRQEIASSIGVDRRSLSGFVSGQIRPTPERLEMLRILATTAEWAAGEFGEHAREVLRGESPETSPLRLIAEGRTDIRHALHAAAARSGLVETTGLKIRNRDSREPLYRTAASVWASQQDTPIGRGRARDRAVYEQDLSKAVLTNRTPSQPRRRRI